MMRRYVFASLVVTVGLSLIACADSSSQTIESGSFVRLHYSLEVDGQAVVTADKPEEMHLVIGQGAYPPAYESALMGMAVNESKTIQLAPEDAYGPIRQDKFARVRQDQLPPNVQVGAVIGGTDRETGRPMKMRVREILEDGTVILDYNHPLAGKTLNYNVTILEVS